VFTFGCAFGPATAIVTAYRDNALRRGSVPIAVYKKFTFDLVSEFGGGKWDK
jgi:hypothetical protein